MFAVTTRPWILVALVFYTSCLNILAAKEKGVQCPYPAVPLYSRVALTNEDRIPSTTATYVCDDGYELFGTPISTCQVDGTWTGSLPYCAVNVAYGKPANQSSTARGGEAKHANDGDTTTLHENKYCTETKVENSPWWRVDLLQPYDVRIIRIISRGCCGHQPLHDLEIRVGNSSVVQGNRLCAWYPGTIEDGVTKDFPCAYPINGRYVFIQMVGIQGSLSMCEVMVFTTLEFSPSRCGNQMEPLELTTFNRTCFEFQSQRGGSFDMASEHCRARGGLLVHNVEALIHDFIAAELERRKDQLKSKLVWLGARRDPGPQSRTWHWVNGRPVQEYLWAEDQPNNYNGQQDCVVLDGGRKWLWNDVTCELDYLPWVCQYTPSNCGSPDRNVNSTFEGSDFRLGQRVTYKCSIGSRLIGNKTRRCGKNGFWTGTAPSCKYVECPSLPEIEHGRVTYPDSRMTYNATARYSCEANYTLVGNSTRWCMGDGQWNGTEPKCLFSWCQPLKAPPHMIMEGIENTHFNSVVKYSCPKGHKLIGNENRTCQLGGTWSGEDPMCRFIECSKPFAVLHGEFRLLNESTTYQSVVSYTCEENYTLIGDHLRTCQESGQWNGTEPECRLINCGTPEVPPGGYLLNHSFSIHSTVEYHCEGGHLLIGEAERKCLPSGKWSGSIPSCKYVDCGRVQIILKGEVHYENRTTHLGSVVTYSCSPGFHLVGHSDRTCQKDGKWSGSAPKCEEVRCSPPEVPKNTTVVYGGNDRSSLESFKIGSTVQYRCLPGHKVQGHPLRTCGPAGQWSGHPPTCVYIDCGLPAPMAHGHWLLPGNTTHYGSQVEYRCDHNFEVAGGPPRRLCLENGSWSGTEPVCRQISCGVPEKRDDKTVVEGTTYSVGSRVNYTCVQGYELSGNVSRVCQYDGRWSGETPLCKLVDCGPPTVIANGRGFLANGTTTFRSVVTYQCLPDFQLIGDSVRTCLTSGSWSGVEPRCADLIVLGLDNLDGRTAAEDGRDADSSKTVGIAVATGAAALLILIIIVSVVCLKSKKNTAPSNKHHHPENIEVQTRVTSLSAAGGSETADKNPVMAYGRLSMDNSSDPLNGAIRSNPNGLLTFSPNPHPIYANVTVNGQSHVNGHQRPPAMHSQPV